MTSDATSPDGVVLIVDDTPDNLILLNGVVKAHFSTRIATNGAKALLLAQSDPPPDLILLDIMMPEMDGYEVCSRLKENPHTRDIPVIFLTAKTDVEDEAKGLSLGAVDYIPKPISPSIVLARISTQLRLSRALRELEGQNEALLQAAELREKVEQITRHDLKNPLTGIIGFPSLLLETESLSERGRELMGLIRQSGYNMLDMINRSLDLYKMEMGTYEYFPENVDIVDIARKVLGELQASGVGDQRLGVLLINDREVEKTDCFIATGEPLLCHSMLSNLVRNAFEAAPKDSRIELSLTRSNETGQCIMRISNQGAVPEAIRERFFEKLVTHGKSNGTGLGTYSARLCAEIQGGSIALDSSSAMDATTIEVRLPLN